MEKMEKMLTKFESKSNRVKGLSFHAVRPWVLASLHNGQIQLWDYRMGTLLDKFEEHDGPVRGVDFHRTQSLIVSGGDDYKVKVWDYKLKRCLFTLLGHLDYIRTVQFHSEYPWIVSASDDQTIRIWNWQSRICISVLTGHNHYVMCASFHPKEDMIVSASLDQTVRVWDTTGLRKKTVRGAPPSSEDLNVVSKVNNELFGGNDAVVKYVLEGHERGVNWAAFHQTLPLIISGADDRQVKLWRMNETKAWEVDTMRGHTNNVSCVLFHPKHELIISNSEDRTMRVWDISKRLGVQTFRREADRFWILAAHPEQNLLAAGHDSGMTVFKLERERPAFDSPTGRCIFVKDRYLRSFEFSSGKDIPLVSLRRTSTGATSGIGGGSRHLYINNLNKTESNVLITSDAEGGGYELLNLSFDNPSSSEGQEIRRGPAISVAFVARDRFAALDKTKQLLIKNFQNEVVKKITLTVAGVEQIFFAGSTGRLLLKTEEKVVLFDFQARKVLAELFVARVKYVVWNNDYSLVALISKHQIVLASKQLDHLCSITETVRMKGGCWDDKSSIFIYTTSNHIKYVLLHGDKGIIRALDAPIYPVRIQGQVLFCLDRECKIRGIELDLVEPLFKTALENKDYASVMRMVKHSRLCGQAIISYLQQKGYPEVALHFVHDSRTRFKLALACGSIQVALNVAHELDDAAWIQLGVQALRQGKYEVVEMAYQKTKQFDQLSFLYLITGNVEKLRKMLKIAEMRNDVMSVVHNSMYLGDLEERSKIFDLTGQYWLASLIAKTHNITDISEKLLAISKNHDVSIMSDASLLMPPTPICRHSDWPALVVGSYRSDAAVTNASVIGGIQSKLSGLDDESAAIDIDDDIKGWDEDIFEDEPTSEIPREAKIRQGDAWADDDLDLSDDEGQLNSRKVDFIEGDFNLPACGSSPPPSWIAESTHCADHFAAGSVESALNLLNRQIAATSVKEMKSAAISLFIGAHAYLPCCPFSPSFRQYLVRASQPPNKALPSLTFKSSLVLDKMKLAYKAFTNAQFDQCKILLVGILKIIPLVVTYSKGEGDDLRELLGLAREYLTAVLLKLEIDVVSSTEDIARSIELAAYFTHCNLQPSHMVLALKSAMAIAFKNKNFVNASSFARRLLDFPEVSSEKQADLKSKAVKVLQKSEQQGRNEHQINYDERNPFSLDCQLLTPLYKGTLTIKCPYCGACYGVVFKGNVCALCEICTVGPETIGLVMTSSNSYRKK